MTLRVRRLDRRATLPTRAYPGDAGLDLYALEQSVLAAGDQSWEGRDGDLIMVPDASHSLRAVRDSAVLLTVAKGR